MEYKEHIHHIMMLLQLCSLTVWKHSSVYALVTHLTLSFQIYNRVWVFKKWHHSQGDTIYTSVLPVRSFSLLHVYRHVLLCKYWTDCYHNNKQH